MDTTGYLRETKQLGLFVSNGSVTGMFTDKLSTGIWSSSNRNQWNRRNYPSPLFFHSLDRRLLFLGCSRESALTPLWKLNRWIRRGTSAHHRRMRWHHGIVNIDLLRLLGLHRKLGNSIIGNRHGIGDGDWDLLLRLLILDSALDHRGPLFHLGIHHLHGIDCILRHLR